MLAESTKQLLTAFVDGELSPYQRQATLQLLQDSAEARELLMQLQENARKIKQMPPRSLDAAFVDDVLEIIAERNVHPVRRPLVRHLRWVPYGIAGAAAAVLFVATLAGVVYVLGIFEREPGGLPRGGGVVKTVPVDPADIARNDVPEKGQGGDDPQPATPKPYDPLIARIIDGTHSNFARHMPPERVSSFPMRDLPKEEVAAALKKDSAIELDLTVRNPPHAMDRFSSVLQKHNIKLVLDPTSAAAMKQATGKSELLVYADNISANELAKILGELAQDEKKVANPFDKLSVASLSPRNGQHVTDLMGSDPTRRVDPSATQGKQQKNSKNPKAVLPKTPQRVVVGLPQSPQTKASAEVNQFLLQPVDPGSLRVLIRIRQE
jgi:hypothetical protein